MATVNITIRERIASIPEDIELICNNPSDVLVFDFDEEWDAHELKTARFIWEGKYIDVPFSSNSVKTPVIYHTNHVFVGVFVDGLTSAPVKIPYRFSIKCLGNTPKPPSQDAYDQIIQLINDNAVKGPSGYSPVRGIDYWTEEDIESIKEYLHEVIMGGEW